MMMKQQSSSIVPSVARGLSILVVDSDTTCLLQLASQLEHYSYTGMFYFTIFNLILMDKIIKHSECNMQ